MGPREEVKAQGYGSEDSLEEVGVLLRGPGRGLKHRGMALRMVWRRFVCFKGGPGRG